MTIGRFTAFAIDSRDGSIWGWGRTIGNAPVKLSITDGGMPVAFKQISDSNEDAIALDTSNRIWNLYVVGLVNSKYALDDGGVPVDFRSISTGNGSGSSSSYMLHAAVDVGGRVWTWGENESGQLGDGGTTDDFTPAQRMIEEAGIPVFFDSVSAGDRFVLGLNANGDIWSWGLNSQGQLGNGTTNSGPPGKLTVTDGGMPVHFVSVAAGYGRSYAIDEDGRIWTWGNGTLAPVKLKFDPSVTLSVSPASSSTKLQSVTLTATVTGDVETPTGTIEFYDGSTSLVSSVPLIGGVATWTTTSLSVSTHSLSANYSGDDSYTSQVSANVSHQVSMPAAPDLTLTPSTTSDTFDPVTVNITAIANGSGNSLSLLKWLSGNKVVSDFAASGTDVTVSMAFNAASNGTYTVYAKDMAGSETVKTIDLTNILQAGDAAALDAAIATAQQALADHPQGTNVGEAPASARNTLQTAIDAAQAVSDDAAHRTQGQLDAATATLNAAIGVFNGAVIGAGDAAALNAAIATAQQALADHPQGTNVGEAPASARNTLQTAIDAAQAVSDDAAHRTQGQLDAATATLNAAIGVFNGAVIGAGDAAALNAAIATAQQALTDHPEGTNVGEAPASARNTLQTAIDAAQAVSDDAAHRTQGQLDAATATLNAAISAFELTVVGVVLDVPASGLYGKNAQLVFTLTYLEPVNVAGTPRLPITAGTGSGTQSVYAVYTGATGQSTKTLTFSYTLTEGMVDEDGIQPASQLELADGADITFVSDAAQAPLSFNVPDASGIRLLGVAPELVLEATPVSSIKANVAATATVYGEQTAGNSLAKLNWMTGTHSVSDFANGTAGTSILPSAAFEVTANGPYSVYARDAAGNEAVKTITISSISTPEGPERPRTTIETSPEGVLVRIAPPDIVREVEADGTVIDKVVLSDYLMDQIRDRLDEVDLSKVILVIDDSEQAVETEFPAEKLGGAADLVPRHSIRIAIERLQLRTAGERA
ncbi:Ig-like domain repeat protein [Cohnella rhizosphaerae]|uniref:Ig-like domain repeat protein n=1 Tax=Cohnella rhizosphaerae TaxID=1457232 RepID=A0A9X4KTD4_9BACL|nr:Ig-like domain repeat protein [Cohnella rhizosphaerae]MDG0810173.1 Ig-like domain repeat protein [Cohnella rhizosphaerae]